MLELPDAASAMVFTNIWVRGVYPKPEVADVVLDLGANVGIFTAYAARAGAAHVFCVEPCPDSLVRLEANLIAMAIRDQATIYPAAIGAHAGYAFIGRRNDVGNRLRFDESDEVARVPVVDAAALLDELNPAPTYVKLDIESNEVAVLRRLGAGGHFENVRVVALEAPADAVAELAGILDASGFSVTRRSWPEHLLVGRRRR